MHMARLGAIYQQCERWENDKPRQRRTKSSAKPDESSLDLLKVRALDRSRVSLLTLVEVRSPVSSAVWEWCFLQIWVCFRKAPWHRKSWSEFQQILGPCQIIAGCLTLRCIQQLQSLAFPVLLSIQLIFEPIFFLLGFLNCWENSTSSELALHFCRGHDYFHVLLDSTATFDKICIDCEFVCVCTCVCVPNTKSICLHLCNLHASYAGQPFHLSFSPHQQACPKSLHPQPCNVPVQLPMLSQVDVTKVTYFWICQIRPCSGVTTSWFGDMRHMPLWFASGEHGSKAWVCWPELLPQHLTWNTAQRTNCKVGKKSAKTEHSAPFSFCMLW